MIYGHMFFPGAKLEAMYTRRLSKYLQCLVTAVNYSRTFVSPQARNISNQTKCPLIQIT